MASNRLATRERLHPQDQAKIDIGQTVDELWNDSLRVNQRVFRVQAEELDYALKLKHYRTDYGNQTDARLLKPVGPELFDLLRHETAELAGVSSYIECRPQLPGHDDPQAPEDAKVLLESHIYDPMKMYARLRRRWIMGSLAARSWVMAIDYVPGVGAYSGEVCFRLVPPWRFHKPQGWQDHHDLTCPWVGEEVDPPLSNVLAMKKYGWNVEGLKPDRLMFEQQRAGTHDVEQVNLQGREGTQDRSSRDTIKLLKWWFRDDGTTREEETDELVDLAPADQFGECPMCGFQEPDVAREESGAVGQAMFMPMCPECGQAPLLPVRQAKKVNVFKAFPTGRLVIYAPAQKKVVYDDAWQFKLRSFPYMELRLSEHPLDPSGISETALHWSSQMVMNNLRRFAWEQMRRNVALLIAPKNGLFNAQNQPWTFNDLHGQIAYYKDPAAAQGINYFQGAGIPSGLPTVYNIFAEQFRMGRGTDQIGLTTEQSKNIPVGTVDALLKQGAIPTRDKLAMIQEEEGIGFGVTLDMLVQLPDIEERAVEYLGQDGRWSLKQLKAAALTNMRVVVSASPKLAVVRGEELDAFSKWANLPPPQRATAARLANIPMSIVRELETAEQAFLEQTGGGLPTNGPGRPPAGPPGVPVGGPSAAGLMP